MESAAGTMNLHSSSKVIEQESCSFRHAGCMGLRKAFESKLQHWLLNRIMRPKRRFDVIAFLGRVWCQRVGWRLICGPRVLITQPQEFIQSKILMHGIYEPEVVAAISAVIRPGDLLLDVGANIGIHSLIGAYQGARVHTFEPLPRLAKRLRQNIALNRLGSRIAVFEIALSNREGEATFYVASRKDDGSHSLVNGVPATSIEQIIVKTTTLDRHLEKFGYITPNIIKIDVEGAEAWVLDGAHTTLTRSERPVLIIETGDRLAEVIGESARSVLGRLFNLDFRVFQLRDDTGCLLEVDADKISPLLCNYLAVPIEFPRMKGLVERVQACWSTLRRQSAAPCCGSGAG